MKVLIVGGGGYVGRIVQPALEAAHEVTYLDLRPVKGAEDRTFVGSLSDEKIIQQAIQGQDAIIYMALGTVGGDKLTCDQTDPAFDVNLRDQYRVLKAGIAAGVKKYITISSLCVYGGIKKPFVIDEDNTPADAFDSPYGISKRLAEVLYIGAATKHPDGVYLVLRFNLPASDEDFARIQRENPYDPAKGKKNSCPTGPNDTRRLMLAALAFNTPGCHIVQTTGDLQGVRYSNAKAKALLGWEPQGN